MSTLLHAPRRRPAIAVEPQLFALAEVAPAASPITTAETARWALLLAIPFALGAVFFALAIGLGTEWLMAPAFLLGPLPLISSAIYLSLSSDANSE